MIKQTTLQHRKRENLAMTPCHRTDAIVGISLLTFRPVCHKSFDDLHREIDLPLSYDRYKLGVRVSCRKVLGNIKLRR